MLDKKIKEKLIKKFATHEGDTGSSEIQIAILSEEINRLIEHLKLHKHDHSSRRGLLKKVSQRRRLLKYLSSENQESFENVCKKLKIKIKITRARDEVAEAIAKEKREVEQKIIDKDKKEQK